MTSNRLRSFIYTCIHFPQTLSNHLHSAPVCSSKMRLKKAKGLNEQKQKKREREEIKFCDYTSREKQGRIESHVPRNLSFLLHILFLSLVLPLISNVDARIESRSCSSVTLANDSLTFYIQVYTPPRTIFFHITFNFHTATEVGTSFYGL